MIYSVRAGEHHSVDGSCLALMNIAWVSDGFYNVREVDIAMLWQDVLLPSLLV